MRGIRLPHGVAVACLLGLSACGSHGGNDAGQKNDLSAPAGDPAVDAKLNAYTHVYNDLIDTNGLPATAQFYEKADIPNRSPKDSIDILPGWIDRADDDLKKARAQPGSLGDLDVAAGTLDDALVKLLARLKPLNLYYSTKAYQQDGLARGKSEDGPMRADFNTASKALEAFNAQLQTQRRASDDRQLTALKAKGDMAAYDTKLAMQRAQDLLGLFHQPADLNDQALLAKGDAIAASIDTLLPEQQKAVADAKFKATEPREQSQLIIYETMGPQLGKVVGAYRQMKRSHSPEDMNNMIEAYNNVVQLANPF